MDDRLLRRNLALGVLVTSCSVILAMWAWADDTLAAIAQALSEASISLERGLKASEEAGEPISGKYEIAEGTLRLSVITHNRGLFAKVTVDAKSGTLKRTSKITGDDELRRAKEQRAAMAQAHLPLSQAVANAAKSYPGYRAVSAVPMLAAGEPVADITLMKDTEVRTIAAKLSRTSPYSTNRID
jgi:hypothetical protein